MKVFFNTKAFDILEEKNGLEIVQSAEEADIAVLGSKTIDFDNCKNLKAVYRFGVGRENIPQSIIDRGTPKVYFPSSAALETLYESTANFTVYLIMYMYYRTAVGTIDPWEKVTRDYIKNKQVLVIGKGNIGRLVARKLTVLMGVMTYDIMENSETELESFIRDADIVTLHIPLNESTRGMIDAQKLSWMKDDSILVNTARGALVDEGALYNRLNGTQMRAAFDVFWKEPYDGKLKKLGKDKFYMTPHSASQTGDFVRAGFKDIIDIIKKTGEKQ